MTGHIAVDAIGRTHRLHTWSTRRWPATSVTWVATCGTAGTTTLNPQPTSDAVPPLAACCSTTAGRVEATRRQP